MVAQSAAGIFWPGRQGATNGDFQIKFLADRIVKAPFWHAQLMLSESHQPNVVGQVVGGYHTTPTHACKHPNTTARECAAINGLWADWMAAVSADGKTLVIRAENPNSVSVNLTATIAGGPWARSVAVRTTCLWILHKRVYPAFAEAASIYDEWIASTLALQPERH